MQTTLQPQNIALELTYSIALGAYTLLVAYATLPLYRHMLSRGLHERLAVYYNRKIIHMLAGAPSPCSHPSSPSYPQSSSPASWQP